MPFDLVSLLPDGFVRHLPVLLVIVPLLLAPVCAAIPSWRATWAIALGGIVFSLICALGLLQQVMETGRISYALGGWAPPLGIEFAVDMLNAPILLLVSAIGVLATIFALPTIVKDVNKEKRALFFAAYLMCFAGLLGVAVTADAFNLFVFLEVSSISTYVLVAIGGSRDRRAFVAGFNYLIMGSIGATFYVIGIGFLYAATGTLNMADIAARIPEVADSKTIHAGFAFIVVGLGLKAAMFPLHQWLPNAYAYAPNFVTVFLSATATKVAFYALIRLLFSVFSPELSFQEIIFTWVLAPLAAIAAIACSFQAIFQTDIKRMLAYSSVAQVGYMLLGLSLASADGVSASLFHLINHAMMKGALFMAVSGVVLSLGSSQLRDFAGIARKAPWTATALGIAALSLVGVPLTAGFLSKVALFKAALVQDWWWVVVVLGISSVLAVLYVGRLLETVFFKTPGPAQLQVKEAPLMVLIPLWVLALACIYYGLDASFITTLTDGAASVAFSGGQP
ncbi:monovalent cation/H+ antiporter subunit D family protein [Ponticaulis sp.]|uniref:monovalent cation/H+ antiporter subunit D family protein n=1 Tax=Ponticaulis sp. TaxID=2020902 RepID=UPI000B712384|nr:monovalent cation/H+ antiporter subunit D family protein [Ponticaulis sp.]MAI90312.1 cation:proton antiporter [Ponticaulis sp.]OUX99951.1 MAG: cation:proton antiporter [Hyphomonadaceae bacterium TMED5]|tara:strand:+ start:288876 stop:290399 length:1524 start_codon:yes stop_codon:yes gene_type:complete